MPFRKRVRFIMRSIKETNALFESYANRFEPVPSGVLRCAPVVERWEALEDAMEQSLETGNPIQNWVQFVVRSPEPSAQAA